jgi:2-oxoisovalerate dehydrogenase E1 component
MIKATANLKQVNDDINYDWEQITSLLMLSRAMDDIEETQLVAENLVHMQFSARGHDLAQVLLGSLLTHPHDAVTGYYRSRPLILSLGVDIDVALLSSLSKSGGYSDGRDVGVVGNYPNVDETGAILLPMCGGVGTQYSPISGWAESIVYHRDHLNHDHYKGAIGVSIGGDSSMSTSGFWAALNISTTNNLPHLFVIEDNGYGISTEQSVQTPGGDQVANISAYKNLMIFDGDGTDPITTPILINKAVQYVRSGSGTALLRVKVPRLCGHTYQDTQTYKTNDLIESEKSRDPLTKLKQHLLKSGIITEARWSEIKNDANNRVSDAVSKAKQMDGPNPETIFRYVFSEIDQQGQPELQLRGGLHANNHQFPEVSESVNPQGSRLNMLTAIRQVLDHELSINPKVVIFGEDVGPKGGVHAATLGLNKKYGNSRVFNTSLSEEGIIGRSVGMALNGLMPVPEIQFRKYAEPAAEQLSDIGTMRWRTKNNFAAPMVVRVPGGFAGVGDPWHSMSDEVEWAHKTGWQVVMPSNAEDAVGLLRYALRDNNPTIFFEHRNLLDASYARRPYPGDEYVLPFGKAKHVSTGDRLTVVTWGAMVERCIVASESLSEELEIIDLRTIQPWDKEAVLTSVRKTGRCLIVHEDKITAGFGAEIAAVVAKEAFFYLDAPIERIAVQDVPVPFNNALMNAVVPTSNDILDAMQNCLEI